MQPKCPLGYAHQDDQDTLAHDVAMKLSVPEQFKRRGEGGGLRRRPKSAPELPSITLDAWPKTAENQFSVIGE